MPKKSKRSRFRGVPYKCNCNQKKGDHALGVDKPDDEGSLASCSSKALLIKPLEDIVSSSAREAKLGPMEEAIDDSTFFVSEMTKGYDLFRMLE